MYENAPLLSDSESPGVRSKAPRAPFIRTHLSPAAAAADSAFLVFVAANTAVLWIGRMGFYLDDWDFLRTFRFSADQSIGGLWRAAVAAVPAGRMRPVQLLYSALSYKAWGAHPLGYHATHVLVLSAAGILLWAVLRELGRPRAWALAGAVLYLTLPNYTTARVWAAAQPFLLSVGLYLSSFYSDLRSLRSEGKAFWGWRALALSSLAACLLAYEVALPLFALNIVAVLLLASRAARRVAWRGKLIAASDGAGLLAVIFFKVATMTRGGVAGGYISHAARTFRDAIVVNWLGYGVGLPLRVWRAARWYPDGRILALSTVIAAAVAIYLWRISRRDRTPWPTFRQGIAWLCLGLMAFALGEAIFLTTDQGGGAGNLTMAGPNNRVAVAATLGVALSLLAGAACVARVFPAAHRGAVFAAIIALLAFGGSLLDNTIANFWVDAYGKERVVLTAIRERFPRLSAPRTIILDGVCPYTGPAPVLHTDYDLGGMLALAYGDPALRADVVTHRMSVRTDGLASKKYGHENVYPFSEDLIVFGPKSGSAVALSDRTTAQTYFQSRREPRCPSREIF